MKVQQFDNSATTTILLLHQYIGENKIQRGNEAHLARHVVWLDGIFGTEIKGIGCVGPIDPNTVVHPSLAHNRNPAREGGIYACMFG